MARSPLDEAFCAAVEQLNSEYKHFETCSDNLEEDVRRILTLSEENIKSISVRGSNENFECDVICKLPSTLNDFIREYCKQNGEIIKSARSRPLDYVTDYSTDR